MSKAFDEYMGGATNTERDDAEQAAQAQDSFVIETIETDLPKVAKATLGDSMVGMRDLYRDADNLIKFCEKQKSIALGDGEKEEVGYWDKKIVYLKKMSSVLFDAMQKVTSLYGKF